MVYIIIVLAVCTIVFGILAFRKSFNHNIISTLSIEEQETNVIELAKALRNPKTYGSAPQVNKFKRIIKKSYHSIYYKISKDMEIYQFEKLIYENYHHILYGFKMDNFKGFAILPHKFGKTRLLLLADYIAKVNNFTLTKESLTAILNKFNQLTPLDNDEIFMLKQAIYYSLVVKISQICNKTYKYSLIESLAKEEKFYKNLKNNDCYLYYRDRYGKLDNDKKHLENFSGNLNNVQFTFTENLAKDYEIIKNIISSLYFLKNEIDDNFLLSINHSNIMLENDALYKSMDSASKIQYLQAINAISQKHKLEEQFVIKKLFEIQEKTKTHFGKYLFQEKSTLKYFLNDNIILTNKNDTKLKEIAFIFAVWGSTILVSTLFSLLFATNIAVFITFMLCIPIALLPFVNNILIKILSFSKCHKPTPKLNLQKLPVEGKTMVILPVFVPNLQTAENVIQAILKLKYSNKGENISFALLVDYKKSKNIVDSDDLQLNKLFTNMLSGHQDINVFVRQRIKQGEYYSGYERKRGAILDLCECLTSGNINNFNFILHQNIEKPNFIVTLDDDNELLPNTIHNAVCSMLHPLNLQYDLMTFKPKYNLFEMNTLYSKRYYFDCGYSRYSASNSFYYNYFGKGIFNGKGIFRLDNFYKKLKNVFPSNRVLSHDIIEGAIVRTGELSEYAYETPPNSIPSELARQSRWFKGDLLLAKFLGSKIKNDNNEITKIKKSPIYNHIICLNIISGFARATTLVLLLLAFVTQNIFVAIPFIFCFFAEYFVSLLTAIDGTRNNIRFKFVLNNIAMIFTDMLLKFFTLPIVAINNIYIAIKTLISIIFAKKNLLNWTTFSTSQGKKGINNYCKCVLPQCFVMLILSLIFFGNLYLISYSAIFIAVTLCLYICGVKFNKEEKLLQDEKDFLLETAKRTYKYFANDEAENKLIRDNLQIRPHKNSSNMTSPTNLGFAILSDISAFELNIISKQDLQTLLLEKINNLISLEKVEGNFYNWYDTKSKKPLLPLFISSVDNGNLLACLIVAKQCILKNALYGIDLITKLIEQMNIAFLLDKQKNLFYIGYNVQTNSFEGHYDLLASEARTLYYLYACKYQNVIPWNTLSRDSVSYGGNILISWSGTMFEYLLPAIFLKPPKNSLLYQSQKNVVKLAKRKKCNYMWGISESGYYKFDSNLNYQYYAFGLNEIAIRNSNNKCVISPYSSALALNVDTISAIKNLNILKREGVFGEYGFYEAIDMTGKKHIIYQYMSHHQGMIMASITNAINGNVISNYFTDDYSVKSTQLLLTEPKEQQKLFKKPPEEFCYTKYENNKFILKENNLIGVLANENYTAFYNCFGDNVNEINGIRLAKYFNTFENFGSKHFVYDNLTNQTLNYYPQYKLSSDYEFSCGYYCVEYKNIKNKLTQEIFIPNCLNGEVRKFTIANNSANLNVRGYMDISLLSDEEYIAHPAFKDLFISSEKYDNNTVIFKRKSDKNTYLAIKLIGLDNIVLESNKSNCYDIFNDEIQFNQKEKSNSFGDIIYPFYSYNANISALQQTKNNDKNFIYYQVMIYSNDYYDLLNKLAQIDDEKAVCNLIYSAKLASISKLNKQFKNKTEFEFLTKLAFKLKYGEFELDALKEKSTMQELLQKYRINCNSKIIYFESKDDKLACLLLDSLNIIKKIDNNFVVYFYLKNLALENQLRAKYNQLNIIFGNDQLDSEKIKKIAFYVVHGNIIFNNIIEKNEKINDIISEKIVYPNITLKSDNGGFYDNKYLITNSTQKPYSNVVCLKNGGFVATNNGETFTFFENSRNNKLTEWRGEPYSKISSEQIVLSTDKDKWCINKYAVNGYVECGQGYITYHTKYKGIKTECTQNMICDGLAKIYTINITNNLDEARYIKLDLALKIALGVNRENKQIAIKTKNNITKITNFANGKSAYVKALNSDLYSEKGYNAVIHNTCSINVRQNSSQTICFVLSEQENIVNDCNFDNFKSQIQISLNYFESLNKINIQTKDESLNKLFNECLLYQTVSSRLNGKCGFYQVGGAIGFRDQLQDCLAYLYSNPNYVREHILECSKRQFIEGDVLHWWHGYAEGVRTRISDDKLFLPYLIAEYIDFTGEFSILNEQTAYLEGESLQEYQADIYLSFKSSGIKGSLYEHAVKAIENSLKFGENGLLLIGGGDWNDALNNVGDNTKGESVWLSMFCYYTIEKFKPYFNENDLLYFSNIQEKLKCGIDNSWNGSWYNRVFTKYGDWLGNNSSKVCKIDLICQSFAIISKSCPLDKCKKALKEAEQLIDYNKGIVKLLSPAFDNQSNYGYICNYPVGVRENGGQYTHAVAWYIKALSKTNKQKAYNILKMINPINLSQNNPTYKNEPYVLSADVYSSGEGGWSWYTGSSSWLYKVILEDFLGIKIYYNKIIISPCELQEFENYKINCNFNNKTFNITIKNTGNTKLFLNDEQVIVNEKYIIPINDNITNYEIVVEH